MKIKSVINGLCLIAATLTAKANYDIGFQTYDFNDLNSHVVFAPDGVTPITGNTILSSQPAIPTGDASQFVGRLFVGPVGGSLGAIGTSTPFAAQGSGAEGFVDGSTITVTDASLNAGSQAEYRFRVWSSMVNGVSISSFAQASTTPGAYIGESALTAITLGGTVPGSPPTLVTATANLHPSFQVALVPEPSVLALGLLGGAALLFRRRK